MSYVAFQYAEALFSLAMEENQVDNVLQSYQDFVAAQDQEIYKFLTHPKISKKDKKEVVSKAISDELFKNFVFVLIDKSRIDYLVDCLEELQVIIDNQNKVMNVEVYSGRILESSEIKRLTNNLSKKHNRKVRLNNIVDESIIGGLRIEYDGNILDETINNYLNTLKSNLTK